MRVRCSVVSVTSDNDAVFSPIHLLVEVAFLTVEVVRDDEGVIYHTIGKFRWGEVVVDMGQQCARKRVFHGALLALKRTDIEIRSWCLRSTYYVCAV